VGKALIVIPARFGSTRFPGKPLVQINDVSMIRRTADIARRAAEALGDCHYVVATDHADIQEHCASYDIPVVMTDPDLPSGSDRALAACRKFASESDIIVNLQGDAPFTSTDHVIQTAAAVQEGADVATPYIELDWDSLDALRSHKEKTPSSGTSVIVGQDGNAHWFSKAIIPAIRKEAELRKQSDLSPVCRHIGLYAYRRDVLEAYVALPESPYERLEGLEQLRLLENGYQIQCVRVDPPSVATPGIDTPRDLALAEDLIAQYGDPYQG